MYCCSHSGSSTTLPKKAPYASDIASELVQKLRRANRRRSTTGCRSVSSQTTNSAKPTPAAIARSQICVEPNQSRSLPLSSMICSAPTHSTSRPRPTPSIGSLRVGRFARAVDHPRDRHGREADRHVDVEDPRPRDVVGDPAAEQRSDDGRHERRDAPDGERAAGLRLRIARQQQRLRQRNHRSGDGALNDTRTRSARRAWARARRGTTPARTAAPRR